MAKSEARRQKQLAKKKAKRDQKRAFLDRMSSASGVMLLANAEHWPIVEALMPQALWERGIGQVILARRHPTGRIACAAFLLDVFCLGVKDALWKIMTESEYDTLCRRSAQANGTFSQVAPEYLAKLVYAAVDYAGALDIAPHPDYRPAKMLLAGIDATQCPATFEFGREGKPYYIQGPYDSPARIQSVMERVRKAGGHYVVNLNQEEAMDLINQGEATFVAEEE